MGTSIGKLSAQITANGDPFVKSLKQTERDANGWSSRVTKSLSKAGSAAGGALQAGIGAAGLAGLGGAGTLALIAKGANDLIQVDQQARMAGVSVGEFRGAMLAAGPAASAMESSLTSLSANLGLLQAGIDGGATRALQRLGLDGSADMEALARSLSKLDTPAQRAAAAYEILGDSAKGVMGLLTDGGASLAQGKSLAERFGLGADSQSIKALKDAKMQVEAFSGGVTNQLALGAAPIVAELAGKFDGLGGAVQSGAKIVAYGGAVIVEAWKGVSMVWDVLKIGFKGLVGYILKWVAWIAEKLNWLSGKLAEYTGVELGTFDTSGLRESSEEWLGAAKDDVAKFWDSWANDKSAFTKVDEFFANVEARSGKAAQAMASAPGLDAMAKRFSEMRREIEGNNPLLQFRQQMSEVEAFKKQGLFAGQPNLEAQMTQSAFAKLQSSIQLPQLKQPETILKGSREAYSATVQNLRGDQRLTVQEQMVALQKEAKKLQEEQVRIGNEANEALKRMADGQGQGRGI